MPSNFDFIRAEWPEVYADCMRAENSGRTQLCTCVFYARRVVVQLVTHIYYLEAINPPYNSDLAARLAHPPFRNLVGNDIATKATLIRKVAMSPFTKPGRSMIRRPQRSQASCTTSSSDAFRYAKEPDLIPTGVVYNPALIPPPSSAQQPALSQAELNQLLQAFQQKTQPSLSKTAQCRPRSRTHRPARAGESQPTQPRLSPLTNTTMTRPLPVTNSSISCSTRPVGSSPMRAIASSRSSACPPSRGHGGFVDYVLWGDDGIPLAFVEAKRTNAVTSAGATAGQALRGLSRSR